MLLLAGLVVAAGASFARPPGDFGPVDAALAALVDGQGLPGASLRVSTGAGEVHRRHLGAYDDTTRVPIASASKWLSALAIARRVERGELRWDTTVGEHFPDAPAATRAITLAQLYSHTSGIGIDDAACLSRRDLDLQACAAQILQAPLAWPPGTTFAYGGNSMQVAGAMAERASGQRWDALFIADVVQPLGLTGTDWTAGATGSAHVPNPNPRIAGGARSTLDDYGRVVDMVLAGGLVGDTPYLSADTLARMALDRTRGLVIAHSPAPAGFGYGLGQWVEARDAGGATTRVSSPGAFGFTPWVDWRNGSAGVIVVHGSGPAMRDELLAIEYRAILAAPPFRRELAVPPPRRAATVPNPPPPARPGSRPREHAAAATRPARPARDAGGEATLDATGRRH